MVTRRACQQCGKMNAELYVHHLDLDPMNNSPQNLMVLCEDCVADVRCGKGSGRP